MTDGFFERPIDDMILGESELRKLDFKNELMTVTLVNHSSKHPLLIPVTPNSRCRAMYVFSRLSQQAVEGLIESLHEDCLSRDFIQIWQVTEDQIRDAFAVPRVTVYLDLCKHVVRYTQEFILDNE